MKNKVYRIRLKHNNHNLSELNVELYDAYWEEGWQEYKAVIKQYGLGLTSESASTYYRVIDEDLFGLFLLEYSDQLIIEEIDMNDDE